MQLNTTELGLQAENLAYKYLVSQGLTLITRNFRALSGEIDLIMQDGQDIVFVEVRSRNRCDFGDAFESISPTKQCKLVKTATLYLQKKQWLHQKYSRFDVVAIHPIDGKQQIEWIKNAFYPT